MKKSLTKILTVVLSLLVVVSLSACTSKKDVKAAFDSYILSEDGTTVSKDFILPKSITNEKGKQIEVTWSSSADCVKLTAREEDYLASVTYPDETTVVTLTVSNKDISKSFTVTVSALSANTFADAYSFKNKNNTVYEDFNLDREITIQGKKATISWSVDNKYSNYLEISEDGNKAIIHQNSTDPSVKIVATFTYKGETVNKEYSFNVSMKKTVIEEVDAWYYNIGTAITFDGYVVAVADPYNSQYGNASLYVVNEDFSAGFYLYRAKCNAEDGAKLAPGAHVTVTGASSTDYNGLREASSTGTVTIKDNQACTTMSEHIYAIDEDIFGDVPAALYHQSSLVSFSKWEVTEVNTTHGASSPTTVLKIKKNDVTIAVNYSKYMVGEYSFKANDPKVEAILAKAGTINVGDYVDVWGVLGYYNGHQITLTSADGITKSEAEAEGTAHPGITVGATVKKVQDEVKTAALEKLITSNKEVTLTTTDGDVTVTYEVMGQSQDVTIEGGKITITPSVEAKVNIKATFTLGDYTTFDFYSIHSVAMTEEEMADDEALKFKFPLKAEAGIQKGYTTHGNTFENVKVEYVPGNDASRALMDMFEGQLYLLPVDTETQIEFTAVFTVGEGDDAYHATSRKVTTLIQPSHFVTYERITNPEAGKEYYFGTASDGKGQFGSWLFADGKITDNTFYLSATEDLAKAVKFTAVATENENEYILKWGDKFVAITQNYKADDDPTILSNIGYSDNEADATPFTYTGEGATLAFTFVSKLADSNGNYNTYVLVQNYTNKQVYIAIKDASHFNNANYSQYQLVVVTDDTTDTQGRADKVVNAISIANSVTEDYALPTTSKLYSDVTISWALKEAVEGQAVTNNTLTITRGETNTTVVLVATAKCGLKTSTKEFTVTVEANAKIVDLATLYTTGMAAEAGATLEGQYEVTGYVKAITGTWNATYGNMNVVISDATGAEITLYRTTTEMTVGDAVHVVGYVEKNVYNDTTTIRFKQGHTVKEHTVATLVTPTELYNIFIGGNATDEQKDTVYLVVAPVTKVVNTPGGTYITGNYFVSDATAAVEAYKLGQADEKTDVLSTVKEGSVIVFYGKATLYGTTVETTPSTLVSVYQPEEPTYTLTSLADVKTKVDASEATEDLYVQLTVEIVADATNIIASNNNGYAYVTLPQGTNTVVGAKLIAKLSSASKTPSGYILTVKEVVSSLAQSSIILGKPIETPFASLAESFNKVLINDVTVANNVAALSATVNLLFYDDLAMTHQMTIEDGKYNFTGYAMSGAESTMLFYVLSYEKALPKVVLTQESLGWDGKNNVAYGENNLDGGEYTFTSVNVGTYGSGIQMKKVDGTTYAYFKNADEFSSDITEIILFFGKNGGSGVDGGTAYTTNLKVEVANNADFTDAVELTGTVEGSYGTYKVASGSYTYIRITNTSGYAVYLNSVTIKMAAPTA